MVAEIGIHDDDKVATCKLQAVHVCGAQAELASTSLELDVRVVDLNQLPSDILGAIGRAVVNNDKFPVNITENSDKLVAKVLFIKTVGMRS